jgi:TonB family protein
MKRIILITVSVFLLFDSQAIGQKQNSKKQKTIVIYCHNCKITSQPKPEYPKAAKAVNASGEVSVEVLIDESGDVIKAKAVTGHPLLWAESAKVAFKAKFEPKTLADKPIRMRAILVYNFISDASNQPKKDLIGKPINLVKPPLLSCTCKFGKRINVIVQAEIDEQGNIVKAVAVTGHPLLRTACEQAARASKFSPTKVSDITVKAKAIISYEFVSSGKWTAKLTNIIVKSVEAEK